MSEKFKNEFLSSMSHEVRTLLNTIVGLSEDIADYENIPEEISEDAEDLVTASKTLLELVNNIIDFSKIANHEMEIVNAPYNPKETFEKLAKANEMNIGDKPINLHTNISKSLPYEVIGDKKHVKEIINNLLSNAIRYTDGGDIWFDVSCINDDNDCNLMISIKDTGRGLKPEEADRVFNMINRLNIERDTTSEGAGLGLPITKSLVDMLGGKIEVESVYGEGSTFIVNLCQKINMLEESDLSRTQRLRLQEIDYDKEGYGYKRILIIDDNKLNIKVVRRVLEQFDLIIDECYNGEECVDIISNNKDYDLILMDIMMPKLSGEETLRRLKELDGFDTPVIALTADAEEGAEEKYESKGFIDYIAKPFSKLQIEEKIDKALKEKEIFDKEHGKVVSPKNVDFYGEWEDDDMYE